MQYKKKRIVAENLLIGVVWTNNNSTSYSLFFCFRNFSTFDTETPVGIGRHWNFHFLVLRFPRSFSLARPAVPSI